MSTTDKPVFTMNYLLQARAAQRYMNELAKQLKVLHGEFPDNVVLGPDGDVRVYADPATLDRIRARLDELMLTARTEWKAASEA